MEKENLIRNKSFEFALLIIKLYKKMLDENDYILSKQVIRSGTSIGANVEESTAAQSKKDFISKMSIASKEARETKYWLRLLKESEFIQFEHDLYLDRIDEVIRILTAIVKSTQESIK